MPVSSLTLDRKFKPLGAVLLLPSSLAKHANFDNDLLKLDAIPRIDGDSVPETYLTAVMKQVSDDIEFGTPQLSDAEKTSLDSITALLFVDPSRATRTETYVKYLDYKKKYDDLVVLYTAETNAAKKISIKSRIDRLLRDWKVFGSKIEVENALTQLQYLAPPDPAVTKARFLASLNAYKALDADRLEEIAANANWVRISASGTLPASNVVLATPSGRIVLSQVARIAFDATAMPIGRAPLSDPLLEDTTWRLKSGLVLSDGNSSVDDPSEILPRYYSGILLVKNLELQFDEDLSSDALKALSKAANLSISGLSIADSTSPQPAVHRKSITIPGPIIVGTIVDSLPKVPSTAAGLLWPQ